MAHYELCPRCELNYIDPQKQSLCDVCKKQMSGLYTPEDDFPVDEEYADDYLQSPFLPQEKDKDGEEERYPEDEEDGAEHTATEVEDAWHDFTDEELTINLPEPDDEDEETEDAEEEDDFEYVSADDYCPDGDDEEDDDDGYDED